MEQFEDSTKIRQHGLHSNACVKISKICAPGSEQSLVVMFDY